MHRMITLVSATVLVLSAGAGRAQTQVDLDREAGQAFTKADAALNRTYDQLLAKASPAGQTALRQAQRTWITFRDQECEFETFGTRDGSVHPMVIAECATQLTDARTKQLQAQLDCQEGDLSCGGQ